MSNSQNACVDWPSRRKKQVPAPSAELRDLLCLDKHGQGTIEYPSKSRWFDKHRTAPLGKFGVFDAGTPNEPTESPGKESRLQKRPQLEATRPAGDPPLVRRGEQAAWLKELWEDELVLITTDGMAARRKRSAIQGVKKSAAFQPGQWFILSGEKSVRPVS